MELINKLFHDTHYDIYQYSQEENDWEIINLHLAGFENDIKNPLFNFDENNFDNYEINVPGESFKMKDNINVKVFSETDLDNQIYGPAIIKFDYTSVLVPTGFESSILDNGILSIKKSVKEE